MTPDKPRKMHLQWRIREALRKYPDGLEISELVGVMGSDKWSIRDALHKMPDAYIDRWHKKPATRGRYAAVWCVVEVPENCPMPNAKD